MKAVSRKRMKTLYNFSLTKSSQDRQTLQKRCEKQYCQYWILCLVVLTRFPANRYNSLCGRRAKKFGNPDIELKL